MKCSLITRESQVPHMQLKFNPSLCNDEVTKKRSSSEKSILRLRESSLDKVPKRVESLISEKADVIST